MSFWLHLAAAKHPDRIAIEGPERSLTYAELSSEATSAARALGRLGLELQPGSRIALALPADEDFVVALHGCVLAGVAAVPVDLRLSGEEQASRLAGAEIVVSQSLRAPAGAVEVSESMSEFLPEHPVSQAGEDPAVAVMHTSGTTSMPKPVVLTHGNFLASALGSTVALGLDPAERWLCPMPLTHVGGLSIPIRSAIYATTAVLHGRFDTSAVLAELMDPGRRITLVSLVPTMLARLLDEGLERPATLRWALLGGGPIAPALLQRARDAGVNVAPSYGMTEACSQIATFGWPLPGVELRLEGPEQEITLRGPIVSAGALDEDGWLRTGDLGRFGERSTLEITGRKSDTIITGGENVAPAEVESILLEHPAVADAGVFGRPDPEWGEALVAAVVLRDGLRAPARELRAHCAARLAAFKVPKSIEFADHLPRTESGKLLRRKLR